MSFLRLLANWLQPRPKTVSRHKKLLLESLEDRLVPSTFTEVEPNNTAATANAVTIATGDIITTKPSDWLIINGAITSGDEDFYQFTLASRAGVFFDIDSRDTGLSTTLNSNLQVFDSTGVTQLGNNNDGYDFQGFAVPTTSTPNASSFDSSLYLDLNPGTYVVRVSGFQNTTGNYELRLLADAVYSAAPPTLNSFAGAADTLYLDFNGHSSTTDVWTSSDTDGNAQNGVQANGPYTAAAFDFTSDTAVFSPAERLAVYNIWRITSEDYAPFKLNVSTVQPASFANRTAFRMVITNSDSSILGYAPENNLGFTFLDSYAFGNSADNVSFTFANQFSSYAGPAGISGTIMARSVEQGNTASHEFGHALGLRHYASAAGNVVGSESVLPNAIMASPDLGLNRETWAAGVGEPSGNQDDLAIISNTDNTLGYRTDDFGSTIAAASNATVTPGGYFNSGVIERFTDRDVFRFSAFGATTITVDVDEYVNNLDVELRLFDSTGVQINLDDSATSFDGKLVLPSLAKGTYYVEVRSDGEAGEVGRYTLRIDTVLTTVELTGATIVVTDIATNGKPDDLSIALINNTYRVHDPNNAIAAGAGVTQVDANTVEVPVGGIVFNTNGASDTITLDTSAGLFIPSGGIAVNGGAGSDTLVVMFAGNVWTITGVNAGNVLGTSIKFTGIENLTGDSGHDVFRFANLSSKLSGKIDGGAGVNWLDYTSATAPVSVNLTTGAASRTTGVSNIHHIIGSTAGGNRLTGNSAGNILVGRGAGNLLTAGAGRSLLIGGFGLNTIRGGAADDLIINGRTVYDSNHTSLESILALWQGAGTYSERIAALQTSNTTPLKVGVTVSLHGGLSAGGLGPKLGTGNFVYQSTIYGLGGTDWFLTKFVVTVLDRASSEVLTAS